MLLFLQSLITIALNIRSSFFGNMGPNILRLLLSRLIFLLETRTFGLEITNFLLLWCRCSTPLRTKLRWTWGHTLLLKPGHNLGNLGFEVGTIIARLVVHRLEISDFGRHRICWAISEAFVMGSLILNKNISGTVGAFGTTLAGRHQHCTQIGCCTSRFSFCATQRFQCNPILYVHTDNVTTE